MLNSKQLIEIKSISRATLNNYVALGILPNPVIRTPGENEGRATRLGYFDDAAVQRIQQVQLLKKQGMSMAHIAKELSTSQAPDRQSEPTIDSVAGAREKRVNTLQDTRIQKPSAFPLEVGRASPGKPLRPNHLSFDGSIEDLPGPAYMVNNNFELIWWNNKAQHSFFDHNDQMPRDLGPRNLLQLLFGTEAASDAGRMRELLMPHLAAGKKRLSQQALMKIYSTLDGRQLGILKDVYEATQPAGKEPMTHFPAML